MFGGFTVRQKFNKEENCYDGLGTYSGSIDGLRFTMLIKDDEIYKVTVQSRVEFLKRSSTFNWFIRDMSLSLRCKRTSKDMYYNGSKVLSGWTDFCCKLEEGDVINNWENRGVTYDCDNRGRVRIRTTEERPVTVMSFIPSVRHVLTISDPILFSTEEVINCWIWDQSFNCEIGYKFLTNGSSIVGMNEWIIRSFLKRLDSKGYQIKLKIEALVVEDSDTDSDVKPSELTEALHTMLNNDEYDDEMLLDLLAAEDDDFAPEDFDYEIDGVASLSMFSDDYISRQPIKSDFESDAMSMSKFWDLTIEYLLDLSSSLTIERAVNNEHIINPSMLPVREFFREMRIEFGI